MADNLSDPLQQESTPELEKQIETLRGELERRRTAGQSNREVIHQMVGEKIENGAQEQPYDPVPDEEVISDPNEDIQGSLEALLEVAATKGPEEGIRLAVKSKNPELIDRFHDALADNIEELITSGTVAEVK